MAHVISKYIIWSMHHSDILYLRVTTVNSWPCRLLPCVVVYLGRRFPPGLTVLIFLPYFSTIVARVNRFGLSLCSPPPLDCRYATGRVWSVVHITRELIWNETQPATNRRWKLNIINSCVTEIQRIDANQSFFNCIVNECRVGWGFSLANSCCSLATTVNAIKTVGDNKLFIFGTLNV